MTTLIRPCQPVLCKCRSIQYLLLTFLLVVIWLFEGAGKVVGRSRLGSLFIHRVEDPSLARQAEGINSL